MAGERLAAPCSSCGTPLQGEQQVCPRCGASRRPGGRADVPTVPGAPLVRAPKRVRVSAHDYVPLSLAREYEAVKRERAQKAAAARQSRFGRVRWAGIAGLALVAFPYAVPAFVFLPSRGDAAVLLIADAGLGLVAGALTAFAGGGVLVSELFFGAAFGGALYLLHQRGFPIAENPAAVAVLAATALLSLVVAGVVGVAVDESVSDS